MSPATACATIVIFDIGSRREMAAITTTATLDVETKPNGSSDAAVSDFLNCLPEQQELIRNFSQ